MERHDPHRAWTVERREPRAASDCELEAHGAVERQPVSPGTSARSRITGTRGSEIAELKSYPRTVASNTQVYYWASAFVYKLWGDVVNLKILEHGWSDNPPRAARAYALASVATYDGLIACWDTKYTYWSIRPLQFDPTVTTVIPTPNFPGYVSAHAVLSSASATVLSYLFPDEAPTFAQQAAAACLLNLDWPAASTFDPTTRLAW